MHKNIFTTMEWVERGLSQATLWRRAARGEIIKLAHGFYAYPDVELDLRDADFIIACKRFGPLSYIGGMSSLFRHGLIDQVPDRVWVMVPSTVRNNDPLYRCIRSLYSPRVGVDQHKGFRMTDVHRSVIDGLYYSAKIGRKTAIHAARKALQDGKTSESKLYEVAKKIGFLNTLNQFWDSITTE